MPSICFTVVVSWCMPAGFCSWWYREEAQVLFARLMSGYGRDASLNARERKAPGTVSITQLPGSPTASRSSMFGSEAVDGEQRRALHASSIPPNTLCRSCNLGTQPLVSVAWLLASGRAACTLSEGRHNTLLDSRGPDHAAHCFSQTAVQSLAWPIKHVCPCMCADDPGTPYSRRSDKSSSEPGDVELIERNGNDSSAYGA
eukprot:GHRQ01009651.1.p1 GENE.GHRQ01009651.1~~GHRQ01009651.1.p1  ORF type:complete len:201 (+),score=30.62 GHRQ01009651.1:1160-1762(+)